MTIDEIFKSHARALKGVEPGNPEHIDQLEQFLGRPLPRELRAYLQLAGGNPGNLCFAQTHKVIRPSLSDILEGNRPRKHGRAKRGKDPATVIYFGDESGCEDCGPACLILSAPPYLTELAIDPDDPPVGGYDYEKLTLLQPRFTDYVLSAIPLKKK